MTQTNDKAQSWLDRSDPVAREFVAPERAEDEKHHQAGLKAIEAAGRVVFCAECERAGINPAGGVSPSLLRALEQAELPGDDDADR